MLIKNIDPLSVASLYIEPYFNDIRLAEATAFILLYGESLYLITNWHVVTGLNADTKKCLDTKHLAIPNKLKVLFHKKSTLGEWIEKDIPLINTDEEPLWLEHPLSNKVDVVAIPLSIDEEIELFSLDYKLKDTDMVPFTASPVSIIGFPLGLSSGKSWPIWKTGHVASDHDLDYENDKPAFLIDATTRKGMSGSPVVMRADSYQTKNQSYKINAGMNTRFLGIYSGRIHADSEIGRVWRPFVISEIIERKLIFNDETGRTPASRNSLCPCGSNSKFKYCCGVIK